MGMALQLLASIFGMVGSYMMFKRLKNFGVAALGLVWTIGGTWSSLEGAWWPLLVALPLGMVAHAMIGDPLGEG